MIGSCDWCRFAASGNAKLPLQATLYSSSKKRAAEANSACSDYVEPACLESLYGIPTTPATDSSNYIVVTGYDNEYPSTTDLQVGVFARGLGVYSLWMVPRTSWRTTAPTYRARRRTLLWS